MKRYGVVVLLLAAAESAVAQAPRSLAVVQAPGAGASEPFAQSVAASVTRWFESPGAAVALWHSGASEAQELTKFIPAKDVLAAILRSARTAQEAGPASFLNTLDRATYALARAPRGSRVLLLSVEGASVAAFDAVPGGWDGVAARLNQASEFCKSNQIRVIVLHASPTETPLAQLLHLLAQATGGGQVGGAAALAAAMDAAAPPQQVEAAATPAAKPAQPAGPAAHVRFFRTFPRRLSTGDLGPMSGLLIVETQMPTLGIQTDAKNYTARARLTQTIRQPDGKIVWSQSKEIAVKGAIARLAARRSGNLVYARRVTLPAGEYKIEAVVEDLVANKSATASQNLRATDSTPGFAVSDVLVVRKLDESVDRFEADGILSYDGTALMPIVDAVFPVARSFKLQLYFLIYPDLQGGKPEMSLEIVRDGQVVERSILPFRDEIRNTVTEGGALDPVGGQKHQFPYLATLTGGYDVGAYEARLLVRQGGTTLAASARFRVVDGPGI